MKVDGEDGERNRGAMRVGIATSASVFQVKVSNDRENARSDSVVSVIKSANVSMSVLCS